MKLYKRRKYEWIPLSSESGRNLPSWDSKSRGNKKKKKKSNYIELLNGKQNKTKQKPTIIKSKDKWQTGKKNCNLNAKGLSLKLKKQTNTPVYRGRWERPKAQ